MLKKVNLDDTLKQKWILGKTTVTNINSFSITHISRCYADGIQRTQKYI